MGKVCSTVVISWTQNLTVHYKIIENKTTILCLWMIQVQIQAHLTEKKNQCHFSLCISQPYKTFGTMNTKLLKINQFSFWLLIYILTNCILQRTVSWMELWTTPLLQIRRLETFRDLQGDLQPQLTQGFGSRAGATSLPGTWVTLITLQQGVLSINHICTLSFTLRPATLG